MNKKIIALCLLLSLGVILHEEWPNDNPVKAEFENFKSEYQKVYSTQAEEAYRYIIFMNNFVTIKEHNTNPDNTYTQGVNQFTDLTFK